MRGPLFDTIVIRPIEPTTKSGLIIPDSAKKPPISMGVVIDVGPGRSEFGQLVKVPVEAGETVSYISPSEDGPYPEIEEDGEMLTLIRVGELLYSHG